MESKSKKLIWAAFGLFLLAVSVMVALQATVGGLGFHAGWSISRYMGSSFWSAVVFALVNCAVIFLMSKSLIQIWKQRKLSKIWAALLILMAIFYVGLSLCPLGLFDAGGDDFGPVSVIHRICSSGLFTTMLVSVADTLIELRKKASQGVRYVGALVLLLGVFFIASYLGNSAVITEAMMFVEGGYILAAIAFYGLI